MAAPYYSEPVRALFARPQHAGDAGGPAVDLQRGAHRVVLSAATDGRQLTRLAFRVFGCPHLVAAAEWFCDTFEGQPAEALQTFESATIMQKLEIPVDKTGRILLLEDAVRALQGKIAAETT